MKVSKMTRPRRRTDARNGRRYERDDGPILPAILKQVAESAVASLPVGDPVRRRTLFGPTDDNP